MAYCRIVNPGVLRYSCSQYSRQALQHSSALVLSDLSKNSLTVHDLTSNLLLIDFLAEGHDPDVIDPLIKYLSTMIDVAQIRVLFNAAVDTDSLPYRARSFVTHFASWDGRFVNDGDQANVVLEQKFLCPVRRPSLGRALFVSQLLSAVPNVRASFGSGFPAHSRDFQKHFPDHVLPILFDGDAQQYQHNLASDLFRTCLFNIVVETSNQIDTEGWTSIFITEKTFKAFDLYQIPVWFAVPGLVNQVRRLGFDLFDDLVDHSYDSEPDPKIRSSRVIAQIQQLDADHSLADCQQLRTQVWPRLLANRDRLDQLTAQYNHTQDQLIAELIDTQ